MQKKRIKWRHEKGNWRRGKQEGRQRDWSAELTTEAEKERKRREKRG
jgi:hypothetical protein